MANTSTDMKHMCFPDTRGMYAKCWPLVCTSTTCGISPCLQHPCGQVRYRSYDMCGPFNHSTIAQNCRPMFPSSPVHLSSLFFSLVIKCDNKADASGFCHVYTGCIRMYSIYDSFWINTFAAQTAWLDDRIWGVIRWPHMATTYGHPTYGVLGWAAKVSSNETWTK